MGAEVQWEWKLNGSKQRKQRKSRGRKQKSERHQHQPYIFFFLLGSPGLPGDAVMYYVCMRATEKCGQPLVGGYRLGVGHICCKYRWNFFFNLHVVVWCESPRRVPEIQMGVYKSERSCIWQLQGALAQASCILDFVYFDVL